MGPSAMALVLFVAWVAVLLLLLASVRVKAVLEGKKRGNDFDPSGADVSPFSNRLCRAHANCYENLPLFASLILLAIATDHTEITDGLALVFVGARLAQSIVHLVSTSVMAVNIRFLFFCVQVAILIWWVIGFLRL